MIETASSDTGAAVVQGRKKTRMLSRRLSDRRSRRVVFLSHCLLNQNTRYLGGACHGCQVPDLARQCARLRLGIVQMPCPEEVAWGGVLKRYYLGAFGLARTGWWPAWSLGLIGGIAAAMTKLRYRLLARRVARQVQDYHASGFEVVAIVGVDGSPSCGVARTMPVARAFERVAEMEPGTLTVDKLNAELMALVEPGQGVFTALLAGALRRRHLQVRFLAHDLVSELAGDDRPVRLGPLPDDGAAGRQAR